MKPETLTEPHLRRNSTRKTQIITRIDNVDEMRAMYIPVNFTSRVSLAMKANRNGEKKSLLHALASQAYSVVLCSFPELCDCQIPCSLASCSSSAQQTHGVGCISRRCRDGLEGPDTLYVCFTHQLNAHEIVLISPTSSI